MLCNSTTVSITVSMSCSDAEVHTAVSREFYERFPRKRIISIAKEGSATLCRGAREKKSIYVVHYV